MSAAREDTGGDMNSATGFLGALSFYMLGGKLAVMEVSAVRETGVGQLVVR